LRAISELGEALIFPPARLAREDGLLAWGGDLRPERLIEAYRRGIFPWYDQDSPILWWSPDPRGVIFPNKLKFSKSLGVTIRKQNFEIRADSAFRTVMHHCRADRRKGPPGSWIHPEIVEAYCELNNRGIAHSLEVWQSDSLVGGLYGLWMNGVFCGESMFSLVADASKTALVALGNWMKEQDYALIDTQLLNPHLESMGAEALPRTEFLQQLPKPDEAIELMDFRSIRWSEYTLRKSG
jgi:leucyl/phenylalanyl-tRNA--protein transferase